MSTLSVKHLLGIKNLQCEDIELIFRTADNFKEVINRPIRKVPSLRDITVANLFFENSTRTRLSFEIAEKRLSADTLNFSASYSSVKKGETLIDTVKNNLAMKVDMIVIRHPDAGASTFLANHIDLPIINAGDGTHEHPTQALLDAYSIKEKCGEVKVCGPSTLIPKYIESLGVSYEPDLMTALEWCDVANMLRIQLERQDTKFFPSLKEYSMMYGLNKECLDSLSKNITVMHPGPINRGVELTSDVADSKQAIILDQVENGVAIRMAVLYLLANSIKK